MKLLLDIRSIARLAAAPLAAAALLSSCSLMHDDLPQCATRPETRATVNFIYDYNTACEDQFAELIGTVQLFVCDEQGHLVQTIERTAADGLRDAAFSLPLELPAGRYLLYAAATESEEGFENLLTTPGAKFRFSPFQTGDPMENLFLTLDNSNGNVDHAQLPLDQMWLTRNATVMEIPDVPTPAEGDPQPADVLVQASVPLQRITNLLDVTVTRLPHSRAAETISPADYDIWVQTVTGRDRLDLLGRPLADATPLRYTPYSVNPTQGANGNPALHAEMCTSRLIFDDDAANRTLLCVKSHRTGETFSWDLPAKLAEGREAESVAPYGWSEQEFLDRQYQYSVEVAFEEYDDGWRYIEVSIPILNWTKRTQNESF